MNHLIQPTKVGYNVTTIQNIRAINELMLVPEMELEFCMHLALDLTIRARSLYTLERSSIVDLYKGFNEVQHVLTGQILNAYVGQKRYAHDKFVAVLNDVAKQYGINTALAQSLTVAMDKIAKRKGS